MTAAAHVMERMPQHPRESNSLLSLPHATSLAAVKFPVPLTLDSQLRCRV